MELEPPECTESVKGPKDGASKARLRRREQRPVETLALDKDSDSEELLRAAQEEEPRTPTLRSSSARPRQLTSPHFSMDTPRASRSPSPREVLNGGSRTAASGGRSVDIGTPLIMDSRTEEETDVQYEWQFEILNNLPRDTAIALVDHLKSTESERAKATKYAVQLSKSNKELHRRLQSKDKMLESSAPSSAGGGLGTSRWLLALLVALLVVAVALGCLSLQTLRQSALQGLDCARTWLSDGEQPQLQALTPVVPRPSADGGAAAAGEGQMEAMTRNFQSQSGGKQSIVETKDGKIKETTVREMMMRETTTREYDPKMVQQLQTENLQMKLQLERLWLDIDDAVHKGQDTVCWKL